jgi:hypothetical protein
VISSIESCHGYILSSFRDPQIAAIIRAIIKYELVALVDFVHIIQSNVNSRQWCLTRNFDTMIECMFNMKSV